MTQPQWPATPMIDPSSLPTAEQILAVPWRCPACRTDVPPLTKICPGCRARFRLPQEVWFHDRGMVLAMLFLVAGPLGIPWLLKSPKFDRAEKSLLCIAVTVYTAVLMAGVWFLVVTAYHRVAGVLK